MAILTKEGNPTFPTTEANVETVERIVLQSRDGCLAKRKILDTFEVDKLRFNQCRNGCRIGSSAVRLGINNEVWIGAPYDGAWPNASDCSGANYPTNKCSLPKSHWTPYGGDWAVDLPKASRSGVYLYAAPQVTSNTVRAKVESIGNACTRGDGGKVVTIGLYVEGVKIGWVKYAHVIPSVTVGKWLRDRWGVKLGTVFWTENRNPRCWMGAHIHMEFDNVDNYSCYNKGWRPGQSFEKSNFLGFVGGRRVSGQPQPCP